MRINNNMMAMNTQRQYAINNNNVAGATEKLSSGLRINRAGDDAAGLAISEKMRAQIRGLNMASKNSQDAISLLQTAEGALNETQAILQRMRELSVQASSDTNQDAVDRASLNAEFGQLILEIDDIADKTTFNNMKLLDGNFGTRMNVAGSTADNVANVASVTITGGAAGATYTFDDTAGSVALTTTIGGKTYSNAITWNTAAGATNVYNVNGAVVTVTATAGTGVTAASMEGATIAMTGSGGQIQTGANQNEKLNVSISDMHAAALNVSTNTIDTRANAEAAITAVDNAINQVSGQRASIGALSNRLSHKINNLDTSAENLQAAESRIRDLDMAKEMTNYTKNNILVQAATAMLAQANSAPQGVLQLLK